MKIFNKKACKHLTDAFNTMLGLLISNSILMIFFMLAFSLHEYSELKILSDLIIGILIFINLEYVLLFIKHTKFMMIVIAAVCYSSVLFYTNQNLIGWLLFGVSTLFQSIILIANENYINKLYDRKTKK